MKYWEYALEPTKYTDDFFHIGAENAPCWLMKSREGLILIDTGLPKTLYILIDNIRKLGFDYRDIKHIIHSHGHIDHIGGTRALVELTGAKTYIGLGDEDSVSGKNQLQWTNEFSMTYEEPFVPDEIIKDGDILTIGDKSFSFISTPGHTAGTMTMFFNLCDKGKEYRAGMFGGAGVYSMAKKYLNKYALPLSLRDDFIDSIDRVIDEKVEIHIGNHLGDNGHREKIELMNEKENPFIDAESWKNFLSARRKLAIEFFAQN